MFVTVGPRGDVTFHEGYLTTKEARRLAMSATVADKPARPEISSAIQNYIDLHRHAAVRSAVAANRSVALCVMVAHTIVGSSLWRVSIEPQRTANDAIAESVENCISEAAFDERRRAMLALLGFDPDTPTVTGGYEDDHGVAGLFVRLLGLTDTAVRDVLAIVMAETMEAGSALIELLGVHLGIDMRALWQADDALLDLIRDRDVPGRLITEVAGEGAATANEAATGKVKRQIIRDCLTGENGRDKVENWMPRWMAFPPAAYTTRGGVQTVSRSVALAGLVEAVTPQIATIARAA